MSKMRKVNLHLGAAFMGLALAIGTLTGCGSINTENDSHFDEDGYAIYNQQDSVVFAPAEPTKVKFYFEVSGSMNGFFRSNKPTGFKEDVWSVMNRCSAVSEIYVMEDLKGDRPRRMEQSDFRQAMNGGAFVSTNSTVVSEMLRNITENLDADNGEVAVFVSDMRYDPVDMKSAKVLVTQYRSDIAKMFYNFGKAASLVCATSDFQDRAGKIVTSRAPYYFLIMGNGPEVARVRNLISAVLFNADRFVDNIEAGFDYGRPAYSFGVPQKCYQMKDEEPTFIGYEDEEEGDTCTIKLNVNLENYRWIMTDEEHFEAAFKVKSTYGSFVKVSGIEMDKKNSKATVILKVYGMVMDSEVLEWSLELPDKEYTLMGEFFDDATNPNDPTKSFSVKDFCEGMFGGLTNEIKPNYILISKKN